ncbi:MAG: ribonuclease HII [Lachnospiraceae bacterium]|nr:ribonuclease HII [Lachnospiraceae bacterium]MBQ6259565.1 ribonuclease HII [Lachnospiraceae bacterium]
MKEEKLLLERARLLNMRVYERKYEGEYSLICGIDEAGRGPLAGPVCAGACILKKDEEILYLNDSKKLSEKRREALFLEIKEKALSYSVAFVDEKRIDEINILNATYEAMQKAVLGLSTCPDLLLVDAVHIPELDIKQVSIVKGDAASVSIAAASILAKVSRDHFMKEMDERYPEYGFSKHKGYGTKAHYEALKKYGPSPIHRMTFLKNLSEH